MHIRDMSLKAKVLASSLVGLALVSVLIASFYIKDIGDMARTGILEKSRAVVFMAEATRDAMAERLASGIVTDLGQLAAVSDRATVLKAVPIVTAMEVAAKNAEANDYEFRVPKFSPRNPVNEPVGPEIEALKELQPGGKDELVIYEKGQIRYFRPIILTEDCLVCHGEPAGSPDPIGGTMEGWKAGEIHGAFEIISSLGKAENDSARARLKIGGFTLAIMLILSIALFLLIRKVLKPLGHYVETFQRASTGDLTARADSTRNDEVGRIAVFFNDFIGTLEGMVGEVKKVTGSAHAVSDELAASSEETAASLHEITVNTEGMKDKIVRLDAEVSASARSAADVTDYIARLSELIQNQASAINQSSASIVQMGASINKHRQGLRGEAQDHHRARDHGTGRPDRDGGDRAAHQARGRFRERHNGDDPDHPGHRPPRPTSSP